jgi:hypothetical protein
MSVYEIEKTIERIGAALTDPNTKIEAKGGGPDPRDDLVKQIENWRTVLTNYRAATMKDQALSVADQLSSELDSIHRNFQSFLEAATTGGFEADQFSDFLSHGLNELEKHKLIYHREQKNLGPVGDPALSDAETMEDVADRPRLELYENDVLDRVNSVYSDCIASVELAEPGGEARLCSVYKEIHEKLELKSSLFGICDFKDGMSSVEAFCTVRLNSIIFFAGPFDLRFDLRTGSARKARIGRIRAKRMRTSALSTRYPTPRTSSLSLGPRASNSAGMSRSLAARNSLRRTTGPSTTP